MNILEIDTKNVLSNNILKVLGNEISYKELNFDKKKYFIGIRPENFEIGDNSEYKFSPKIELIENLGNEKIIYMTVDEHQLSAKISSKIEINKSFGFSLKNVFIFDENGKRIRS